MKHAIDIETEGLPLAAIQHLKPEFKAPANYKDEAKIRESILEQEKKWLEGAALSPMTGKILVIGFKTFGKDPLLLEGNEKEMLLNFWFHVGQCPLVDTFYGHAMNSFDLPYLVKRSWLHGVAVPSELVFSESGYVNSRKWKDTMVAFQCGDRTAGFTSLDKVSKFFGLEGKTEDIGAEFGKVYAEDRPRALSYLKRDLELVEAVAGRMFT